MDDDGSQIGRHARFLAIALRMAGASTGNHRHGAVIVSGGRIIAKGCNNYTHERHAEVCAIGKNWLSNLKGAIIYIARIRKNQPSGMSRPCPQCMQAIKLAGIKKICYTTDDINNPIAIERV